MWAAIARLAPVALLRRVLIPREVTLDSLATVVFSSGSTGTPKGVMLTHRNIISNVEGMLQAINVDRNDCLLGVLPFFHSFGFTVGLWLPAIAGFGVVYHTNPLEARTIGELCRKYRVTLMIGAPTFWWEYVRRMDREDLASVRVAIAGAEKMRPELADAFWEKFHLDLVQGYGCTETSPVVAVETAGRKRQSQMGCLQPGSVGRPMPGTAVRVVNPETFDALGPGQEGMLLVKGPSVMAGYLDEPEKTRQAIWGDGWYITGDVAQLDEDGFITITDRLSRFSKIAGEMVSHVHLEEVLHRALGSLDQRLVVTSVSDHQKGERFVVLHLDLGLEVEQLLKRVRDSGLPPLWVPRREHFYQVESLPVMGSGKLDLKLVKETAQKLTAGWRWRKNLIPQNSTPQTSQVPLQLPRIQKLNGVQAQPPRAFQVQRAVVDEDALFRLPLREVERQAVNLRVRFGYSQVAGAEEDGKVSRNPNFSMRWRFNSRDSLLSVASRTLSRLREPLNEGQRIGQRFRLRIHEIAHLLFAKGAGAVEDGAIEILIEVELPRVHRRAQHLVPALKIVAVQTELLHQPGALAVIPAVGQQHAAHVAKHGGDFGHATPPVMEQTLALSQPTGVVAGAIERGGSLEGFELAIAAGRGSARGE